MYLSRCFRESTPYVKAVYELSRLAVRRAWSVMIHYEAIMCTAVIYCHECCFFRTYLAKYDWIYALMPDSWRARKLCNLVHEFSMGVIKSRKAELKKKKVSALVFVKKMRIVFHSIFLLSSTIKGKRRKYSYYFRR